jgi:hypothetical protein
VGLGVISGPFTFPTEYFPYLPHVLGIEDIDLCSENSLGLVEAAVRKNVALAGISAREDSDNSEYVTQSLNNLRRNSVPINPDIGTVSSRRAWGHNAISVASGSASGAQHPAGAPMSTAPLQPPATPPTPTTPPPRLTKQIRFTLPTDDDAMQPKPTTPPSATNTEDVAMQPVPATPPSRSTAPPTEDVTMQPHPTTPPAQDSGVRDPDARPTSYRVSNALSLPIPPPPPIPQQSQLPDTVSSTTTWLPVPLTDATALAPRSQGAGASSGVRDPAEDDANARHSRFLLEVSSGRPFAIHDPIIVDADPQEVAREAELKRQLAEATSAREDATSACQEAETLLRSAWFGKQDPLLGIGQPRL